MNIKDLLTLTFPSEEDPWTIQCFQVEHTDFLYRFEPTMLNTIESRAFFIIKQTPKGVWIENRPGNKKFVNLTCRKKYAHRTQDEALTAFIARRHSQVEILTGQLARARRQLEAAEKFQKENQVVEEDLQ